MPAGVDTFTSIALESLFVDCAVVAAKRKPGAFVPFTDPCEPAPTAHVFWSADALPLSLMGTAARTANADLCLSRLPGVRHLMIDAKGTQYIKFRSYGRTLSVILDGAAVAVAPARVVFHIDGLGNLKGACDSIATLDEILRRNMECCEEGDWTATSLTMRDALIAFDGHRASATYREIATVIFGAKRTVEAWKSPSTALKDRIRRALKRGLDMVAGGYRTLL